MSYDIYITNESGETLTFDTPLDLKGGTYAAGGTTEAHFNITFNYAKYFYSTIDADKGIKVIHGQKVVDTIELLTKAMKDLMKQAETFDLSILPRNQWTWNGAGPWRGTPVYEGDYLGSVGYWTATPGNAAKALKNLLDLAFYARNKGIWRVSA
jgi:hypothetical protein